MLARQSSSELRGAIAIRQPPSTSAEVVFANLTGKLAASTHDLMLVVALKIER